MIRMLQSHWSHLKFFSNTEIMNECTVDVNIRMKLQSCYSRPTMRSFTTPTVALSVELTFKRL